MSRDYSYIYLIVSLNISELANYHLLKNIVKIDNMQILKYGWYNGRINRNLFKGSQM